MYDFVVITCKITFLFRKIIKTFKLVKNGNIFIMVSMISPLVIFIFLRHIVKRGPMRLLFEGKYVLYYVCMYGWVCVCMYIFSPIS